ncbi:MAG: phosphate ABC transporter permease PstA [Rickettsiales bacterium]|nr:phosphate ABC transporter permease PstA [Rickettsiales bacterium]
MSKRAVFDPVRLARRHRAERRFQWYGRLALGIAFSMLVVIMVSIVMPGLRGFVRTEVGLTLTLPYETATTEDGKPYPLSVAASAAYARDALKSRFPEVTERSQRRQLLLMLAPGYERDATEQLADAPRGEPVTLWLGVTDGLHRVHVSESSAEVMGVSAAQREWLTQLTDSGQIRTKLRVNFLSRGDSRAPEKAGMGSSIMGSLFTLLICMGIAFPVGVMAAVYLEEFAKKGRLRDVIEVNINNLAAVPSIVFGLLGLALFLGFFGLQRSSSLVGGMTLALMVLPVIIIATRAALQAVPPSIRDGARALGASPLQVVAHHVVPLALPGILTGTILGMARAIGETAPLLMIGMVAFIADIPRGVTDPATAMPVQIFLWAGSPERGFAEKTASAILVLMAMLLTLNALAIWLRRKYERRW